MSQKHSFSTRWRIPLLLTLLHCATALRRLHRDANYTTTTSLHHRHLSSKTVDVPTPTSREDHRVTGLPYLEPDDYTTPHYAGLLPANKAKTKYLFYWLFEADTTSQADGDIPLLLWLNGGPGCSSMDGLFLEHGPLQISLQGDNTWKLVPNPHSWHTAPAHVVYVDQPVGTGLSFTTTDSYPNSDEKVNQDFYYFLREFLLLHSDVFLNDDKSALKVPFFFSGESHAGHYIPSMIHYIHSQHDDNLNIRVDGAAIGNGWVDPYHQYAAAEASYGKGLIDLSQKLALDDKEQDCQGQLSNHHYRSDVCMDLLDDIVAQSQGKHGLLKISQYDARKWEAKHAPRVFPLGHDRVESYLGGWPTKNADPEMTVRDAVLKAIHAVPSKQAGQRYQECTDPPYNALAHQDGLGVVDDVVALLEDSTRLLFFNGMEDLICNHVGNEVLLMKLPWLHREDWILAERYSWTSTTSKDVSGYMKEFENLQFLKVLHSGHMVPMDVPKVALDMMRTFMYSKSFQSNNQDLEQSKDEPSIECPVCPACDDNTGSSSSSSSSSSAETKSSPAPMDDDDTTSNVSKNVAANEEDASSDILTYVVAHSWIGAVLGVLVFLGAYLYVRRRGIASEPAPPPGEYGNLEMKVSYRDEPSESSGEYRDDEDEEEPEVNGNGII